MTTNSILLLTVLLFAHCTMQAQFILNDELTFSAYLAKDGSSAESRWQQVVNQYKVELNKDRSNERLVSKLALAEFGLQSSTMRHKDEELFNKYVDDVEELLESLDNNKKWAEPKALLGSLYGLILAYSPWKGIYLGPKSNSLLEEALSKEPTSPLVWKLYGNSKFFTPESFGGDIKEAIRAYEKAISIFENKDTTKNNWFYIDTMAFLGQAYMKNGQTDKAISIYQKALKLEPEFSWVKYALLPKTQNKN